MKEIRKGKVIYGTYIRYLGGRGERKRKEGEGKKWPVVWIAEAQNSRNIGGRGGARCHHCRG